MIEDIKAKGTAAIYCDNLISYLTEVENSPEIEPTPIEIERYKADLQNWIQANKLNSDSNLEMFRSVISSGQSAIKSSFLLNGGASVALLAFIGHLAQFQPTKVPAFGTCLLPFTFGVLAIAITSGLTYVTQWLYASSNSTTRRIGFWLNVLCIFLGFASYAFFAFGLISAYQLFAAFA
ncbi:hypothetical protein [Methylomonas koyamae]|nr:hypothetical protein [Methylomonas koyamae]